LDIFVGKKYGCVVPIPTVPASAKSTAHLGTVVPTPTPPKIANFPGAVIPISSPNSNVVAIPIAPLSFT